MSYFLNINGNNGGGIVTNTATTTTTNNNNNNCSSKMSSNTSLDNSSSDPDFSEFLNEYLLHTNSNHNEPILHYEEGEMEAEWLVAAGFGHLTKPFEQGLELRTSELEPVLATLSKPHAEAIKQRVRALNSTVRGRTKSRQKRKPDIRDVFRDFDESSTGTRSRSATPDSLDSIRGDETWTTSSSSGGRTIPNFTNVFDNRGGGGAGVGGVGVSAGSAVVIPGMRTGIVIGRMHNDDAADQNSSSSQLVTTNYQKQKLRRTPSAPLKGSTDIFRGSHVRCDIPMYSADGIELLGFSRIGTIHIPRVRSGSDPSCSVGRARGQHIQDCQSDNNISSSDSSDEFLNTSSSLDSTPQKILTKITLDTPPQSAQNSPSSRDGISFENMMRESSSQDGVDVVDSSGGDAFLSSLELCCDIDTINESDLKRLQPIFWLELATLFDHNHVTLDKRKPFKRRRKEEGNLFGVSLNALIRRDQQITGKDSNLVPLFLEGLLDELTRRGAKEEGILRVAGHKQKTELLYAELEAVFYQKPKKFAQLIGQASVHDLAALLKRWLRELPQPLLTSELIQLFYQLHAIPLPDQTKALAIVCQMLPHENRNTLRSLIRFLNLVVEQRDANKMTMHNVATIIAPSFFPPRHIHPADKNSIEEQVKMAAQCCRLTSVLIARGDTLFQVPKHLIEQSRMAKTARQGKRALQHHRRVKASNSLMDVRLSGGNKIDAASSNNRNNIENISMNRQQTINPSHVHRLIV